MYGTAMIQPNSPYSLLVSILYMLYSDTLETNGNTDEEKIFHTKL